MRTSPLVAVAALAAVLAAGGADATVPGVNGKILFMSDRVPGDNFFYLYTMNADGTNPTRLTSGTSQDWAPAWSPDGQRIAFVREGPYPDFYFQIHVMNADGSGVTQLTSTSTNSWPAWSPDGQKIAFTSERDDPSGEIYVMDADGSNVTRLTYNDSCYIGHPDWQPAWSPDGTKIAFYGVADCPNAGVYVMNADGSGQTLLTAPGYGITRWEPDWSPDGQKIVFSSNETNPGNGQDLYVMNADGSGQTRITDGTFGVYNEHPAWSPDGTKIAFAWYNPSASPPNRTRIAVMNPDGSSRVDLTAGVDTDQFPRWQPLQVTSQLLAGTKLLLGDDPLDAAKRKLTVLSKDPALTIGGGNGSSDDPVVNGGSLRVTSAGFDATYPLPAANWQYLGIPGANKGYKYKDALLAAGPVKVSVVKPAKLAKAVGKGAELVHTLASNPDPVAVVLTIGTTRYCLGYGGTVVFQAPKKFLAKNAPAPAACP